MTLVQERGLMDVDRFLLDLHGGVGPSQILSTFSAFSAFSTFSAFSNLVH